MGTEVMPGPRAQACGNKGSKPPAKLAMSGPRSCRALDPKRPDTWIPCLPCYMGPWRSQQPWSPISHDHLGTKVPGHPATEVPAITMHPSGQAAVGNSVPSCHRPPWSLALMGPSTSLVPRPSPHQDSAGRMVPVRTTSRVPAMDSESGRRWSIDRLDLLGDRGSDRQDLGTMARWTDGSTVPWPPGTGPARTGQARPRGPSSQVPWSLRYLGSRNQLDIKAASSPR